MKHPRFHWAYWRTRLLLFLYGTTEGERKLSKPVEDTLEASIVVLGVFAWLAAMTLLP